MGPHYRRYRIGGLLNIITQCPPDVGRSNHLFYSLVAERPAKSPGSATEINDGRRSKKGASKRLTLLLPAALPSPRANAGCSTKGKVSNAPKRHLSCGS